MADKECVISSGESVACLPIKTCFKYTGIGVEKKIEISGKLMLDTKKQLSSRLFFLSREDDYEWSQNVVLTKEVPFCKTYDVYLIPNVRDKLTALEAQLNCQIPERAAAGEPSALSPVLGR